MRPPAYDGWTNERLIEEVKKLKKRKKYGIVWEHKPEDVVEQCKRELPVLKEVKSKEVITDPTAPVNLLIEGDNYHALSVLNYTHKGKISVIYLDPPFNTGSRDWKYNNDYVDSNDSFRHSKWLSMMSNRLRLARNLLSEKGVIYIAIDHYELFSLGLLCDEIFGEANRLGVITVVHKPEGRQFANFFSPSKEFMMVYAKDKNKAHLNEIALDEEQKDRFSEQDEHGSYRLKNFIRLTDGKYSLRENAPDGFYPIYVSKNLKNFSLKQTNGYKAVFPITDRGIERTWKTLGDTFMKKVEEGNIIAKEEGNKLVLYEKLREDQVIKTHWIRKEYHSYHFGTKILEGILGPKKFDFPKSLNLIVDILKLSTSDNSIVLDFFAGSGTTGHAVLELNKQDEGNRQFILVTNNENKIAEEITYERVKRVMRGYKNLNTGEKIAGLGGSLAYYKTSFVGAEPTDANKEALTAKATEMLCVREGTFELVKTTKTYKIFRSAIRHTGIIFDPLALPQFRKELIRIKGSWSVYVFSLGDDTFDEEFADFGQRVKVSPVPEAILRVYRRIFSSDNNYGA